MTLLSAEDVFVTDGYPKHTYVDFDAGQKETDLLEGLEQQNKIISIAGPSKSGKSTLVNKVFGIYEKGTSWIKVTGDMINKSEDLWFEAYRQITPADSVDYSLRQPQIIEKLVESTLPLIIDDYHYIPVEVQKRLSRQIKNAAGDGLRIICLTVPHRGDDPIRSNNELAGRFFSVSFKYWDKIDLQKIAEKGFPLVGFSSSPELNGELSKEALTSPQIMQTLCLEACRTVSMDKPLENVSPSEMSIKHIKAKALRSYNFSTALQKLEEGPSTRGKPRIEHKLKRGKGDVYQILVKALKLDPPALEMSFDEIRNRVRGLLKGVEDPNIRSALKQYPELFKDKEQPPPLDWDDEKKRLNILDPHFYFYLRNFSSKSSSDTAA